jgi:NAD(P)-dependent dehydrogenase (short-subunit alcohol dehydrogenase family)
VSRHEGRIAVITGAALGLGLGREYARRLASERARIVIADVAPADQTRRLVRTRGRGPCRAGRRRVFGELAELGAAVASFGGADIFIHNAGIYPMETLAERDVRVMPARHGRQPRFDVPALQASEVGDKGVTVNALSPEVGGHREMGVFERSPALRGSSPTGCPPTSPALV